MTEHTTQCVLLTQSRIFKSIPSTYQCLHWAYIISLLFYVNGTHNTLCQISKRNYIGNIFFLSTTLLWTCTSLFDLRPLDERLPYHVIYSLTHTPEVALHESATTHKCMYTLMISSNIALCYSPSSRQQIRTDITIHKSTSRLFGKIVYLHSHVMSFRSLELTLEMRVMTSFLKNISGVFYYWNISPYYYHLPPRKIRSEIPCI